jgi:transcriptional regulator with XRE-family HTH domain
MQTVNELRNERERRGWSLDDVSSRTRIPKPYLKALEDGNHEVLPPGPFFRGYLRQYLEFLGQKDETEECTEDEQNAIDEHIEVSVAHATSEAMATSQGTPLMRLVLAGFVLTLLIMLTAQVTSRLTAQPTIMVNGVLVPAGPPHHVQIYAIEDVQVEAITDGKSAFDAILKGTTSIKFQAQAKLELDISDLTRVRLHYNEKRIEPLGSVSRGRRLVFIHENLD